MTGKIIIERADGSVETREMREIADLEKAKSEYVYIAAAWDCSARFGNQINYYFRERRKDNDNRNSKNC